MPHRPHSNPTPAKHGPGGTPKRPRATERKRPTCQVPKSSKTTCSRPVKDNAYVCRWCAEDLTEDLTDMGALAEDLAVTYTRRAKMSDRGDAIARTTDATTVPWDDRARRRADELTRAIHTWTVRIRATRTTDHPGPACPHCHHKTCKLARATRPPADDTLSEARWLLANVQWIRHYDRGPELVDEIRKLRKAVLRTIDRKADLWYAGRCLTELPEDDNTGRPAVCEQELYARPDATTIDCRRCNTKHLVSERRAWLLEYAEDMLAPSSLIARAVTRLGEPVTASRIRKWKFRGKITPVACDVTTKAELYLVGDVLELLREHATEEADRLARQARREADADERATRHGTEVA